MGMTAQGVIDALSTSNMPGGEVLTRSQIIDLVRSVEWDVSADKTVLLYSGEFAYVGGEVVATYWVVQGLTEGAPGRFFIDADTGIGQVLNAQTGNVNIFGQALVRAEVDPGEVDAIKAQLWTEASEWSCQSNLDGAARAG